MVTNPVTKCGESPPPLPEQVTNSNPYLGALHLASKDEAQQGSCQGPLSLDLTKHENVEAANGGWEQATQKAQHREHTLTGMHASSTQTQPRNVTWWRQRKQTMLAVQQLVHATRAGLCLLGVLHAPHSGLPCSPWFPTTALQWSCLAACVFVGSTASQVAVCQQATCVCVLPMLSRPCRIVLTMAAKMGGSSVTRARKWSLARALIKV